MENKQKILNRAFYATLIVPVGSLYLLLFTDMEINTVGIVLFFLFPILGFMVKKGSKKASLLLLIAFIVERIASLFVGFSSPQFKPFALFAFFAFTWVYWLCFYPPYYILKKKQKKPTDNDTSIIDKTKEDEGRGFIIGV